MVGRPNNRIILAFSEFAEIKGFLSGYSFDLSGIQRKFRGHGWVRILKEFSLILYFGIVFFFTSIGDGSCLNVVKYCICRNM